MPDTEQWEPWPDNLPLEEHVRHVRGSRSSHRGGMVTRPGNPAAWQTTVWMLLILAIAAVMIGDHHKRVDQARIKACISIRDEAVRGICLGHVGGRW